MDVLSAEQLRGALGSAAERYEDVEREIRLLPARAGDDLAAVRAEIDRGLRRGGFWTTATRVAFPQAAGPTVAQLEELSRTAPTRELVELL